MKTIAVLTSGGDAPGMNAALRAIVKVAAARGVEVMGVERGYDGLIDGRLRPLTRAVSSSGGLAPQPDVEAAGGQGGTMLGSARSPRFLDPDQRREAGSQLASHGVEALVVIGGNGSLTGAHAFALDTGLPVVGVPASIDNDIGCTTDAVGVDTALNTIVEACDRISDTARSHHRAFVVEVMGRRSGYLAMAAAVAVGADAVLLPERDRSAVEVVEAVERVVRSSFAAERDKRRVLIVKAEGVPVSCTELVDQVGDRLGDYPDVEVRATVLGHVVRGGRPSFHDRMIAGRLGLAAVEALAEGAADIIVGWAPTLAGGTATGDPSVKIFELATVIAETEALLDGSSPVTQRRLQRMESIQGVLAL